MAATERPLYLINGPLGAGKTTLLRRLLTHPTLARARVIENEFASSGIDAAQLATHRAEVRTIVGSCVCCGSSGQLTDALEQMADQPGPVIIEASGVANSLLVLERIIAAGLLEHYHLGQALFVIDAAELADRPDLMGLYQDELAAADTVLITKTDLLDPADIMTVWSRLEAACGGRIQGMHHGQTDLDFLTHPSRILEHYRRHDGTLRHAEEMTYTVVPTDELALTAAGLTAAWPGLCRRYGLERLKGAITDPSGTQWHIEATPRQCLATPAAPGGEDRLLVCIGAAADQITSQDLARACALAVSASVPTD